MGYLCVDFGHHKIRLLEADGSAKKLKLSAFHILNTSRKEGEILDDPSSRKVATDALKQVLSKNKFSRDPSAMALDSSFCIARDLSLPFKGDDQIRKVIKFEAEGHIQHDIDDVVVSHFKKSETIDKSNLIVLAARKNILQKHLAFLDEVNVDPLYVDLDILSLFNALSGTGILKEKKCFVVMNFGRDAVDFLVIDNEHLLTSRSIPLGMDNITAGLRHDLDEEHAGPQESTARLLGISDNSAISTSAFGEKTDSGEGTDSREGPETEPSASISDLVLKHRKEFFRKLSREIRRCLTFVEMAHAPETVYVTGEGCGMPGLEDTLSKIFGTEVEELDFLSRLGHSFPEEDVEAVNREVGTALGLAYKQAGHNATRVDLRQEDVKYTKKFDQVKVPLASLVLFLLILTVLMNLELFELRRCKQSDMNYIYGYSIGELRGAYEDEDPREAERIVASLEPGTITAVRRIRAALDAKNKELMDVLGRGGTIPELPSAFPVWHALFDALHKNEEKIEIFKLDSLIIDTKVSKPIVTMTGEVGSGGDLDNLIRALEAVPIFAKVDPPQFNPVENGNFKFSNMKINLDLAKNKEKK